MLLADCTETVRGLMGMGNECTLWRNGATPQGAYRRCYVVPLQVELFFLRVFMNSSSGCYNARLSTRVYTKLSGACVNGGGVVCTYHDVSDGPDESTARSVSYFDL